MSKLFGESINFFTDKAFLRGLASAFSFGNDDRQGRKIREYLSQDPRVIDEQARQSDLEAIAGDAEEVRKDLL